MYHRPSRTCVPADLRLHSGVVVPPPVPRLFQLLRLLVLFDDVDAGLCVGDRVLYPNDTIRWLAVRQFLRDGHRQRQIIGCIRASLQYGMPRLDYVHSPPQPYDRYPTLQALVPAVSRRLIDPVAWMPRAYLGIAGPLRFDRRSQRLPSLEHRQLLDRQAIHLPQWPNLTFHRAGLLAPWAMQQRPQVLLWDLASIEPYMVPDTDIAILPHLPGWSRQTLPGQVDVNLTGRRYRQALCA
jgi:hypothetical protein